MEKGVSMNADKVMNGDCESFSVNKIFYDNRRGEW